jgi:hypothetical protein
MTTPREAGTIGACYVEFTRVKEEGEGRVISKPEYGIAVMPDPGTSDVSIIIDFDGKPVPQSEMWNYYRMPWMGAFMVLSPERWEKSKPEHPDQPVQEPCYGK